MSTTNYLKLNKHDNVATNENEFDIDNYLNVNWDKIDGEFNNINANKLKTDTKLQNLETDNTDNKNKITILESTTDSMQEKLSNAERKVNYLESELADGQAEGENITVNDSAEYDCSIGVSGNSRQNGTPTPDTPVENETVGSNVNLHFGNIKNGLWLASNGAFVENPNYVCSEDFTPIEAGTEITISTKLNKTGTCYLIEYDTNKQFLRSSYNTVIDTKFTFTTGTNTKFIKLDLGNDYSPARTTNVGNFKLEKGTVATPYSEYGQGNANIVACNNNLLNKNWGQDFVNRVNNNNQAIIEDFDNKSCVRFQCDAGYGEYDTKYMIKLPWKENTSYAVQFDLYSSSGWGNVQIAYTDNTFSYFREVTAKNWNKISYITPSDKTIKYIAAVYLDGICHIDLDSFMISENTIVEDYVEHQEQAFTIPIQQEMLKIGDVKDGFEKVNGVWKERHSIDKYVWNGTEPWRYSRENTDLIRFYRYSLTENSSRNLLCSKFQNIETETEETIWAWSNFQSIDINIKKSRLSDVSTNDLAVASLKSWLSENPLTVYYISNTPTYLNCTSEQIAVLDQLEQAQTYYGQTNVFSTDELPPYIKLDYKKSNRLRIENLENAILSLGGGV